MVKAGNTEGLSETMYFEKQNYSQAESISEPD
jgi:hypothetical protein